MAMNFDKDQLKQAFDKHADDRGKSNTLNLVEFGEMMVELVGHDNCNVETIKTWFAGVCGDDDECSFDEFWTGICKAPATNTQLEKLFNDWDADNSGALTKEELTKAMKSQANFTDEMVQQVLDSADPNDDGKISKQEFMKHLA